MNKITPYKGRKLDPKKRVKLYRHIIHKDPKIFSLVQEGLVVAHTEEVSLKDCRFIVRRSGQIRVRKEKVKNVHAWIEGLVTDEKVMWFPCWKILYNPYIDNHFTTGEEFYVDRAANVCVCQEGVFATNLVELGILS